MEIQQWKKCLNPALDEISRRTKTRALPETIGIIRAALHQFD